jgi:hypothetical protein
MFFYKIGYARWKTAIFFLISKGIDHGQENYNDPILLSVP